ncbi:hypothetical protein pb186bvf_015285 [Paramecium bursaria]
MFKSKIHINQNWKTKFAIFVKQSSQYLDLMLYLRGWLPDIKYNEVANNIFVTNVLSNCKHYPRILNCLDNRLKQIYIIFINYSQNIMYNTFMSKNKRFCQYRGHEKHKTQYICTFNQCMEQNKWLCSDCLLDQVHNHGQSNQNHIMKQEQFIPIIKQKSQTIIYQKQEESDLLHYYIKETDQIIEQATILRNQFSQLLNNQGKQQIEEINQIVVQTEENPLLLESSQLDQIFNNQKGIIDLNQQEDQIVKIIKQSEALLQLIREKSQVSSSKQEFQFKKQQSSKELVRQSKYEDYFEFSSDNNIITAQISDDNKYIVFGGWDKNIQVFDLQTKELVKYIQIDQDVMICKFDKDSKYLMCGNDSGQLYCYEINKNFKELLNKKIHSDWINDIILLEDTLLTCSSDTTIKITNIKSQQTQLLFENDQKVLIYGLEYDQQKNIIISCQSNGSINFIDRKSGNLVFQKRKAHPESVSLIQLTQNNNNLLSSDTENLILWQIDYPKKQLLRLREYSEFNYNFTSVCNHSKIILICKDHVKILDNNLNVIQQIGHNIDEFWNYFVTRQLNDMSYIIIPGNKSIRVMKRL